MICVRFGSLAEVRNRVLDVGFTPKNRHYVAGGACPLLGVKETFPTRAQESANDPRRTHIITAQVTL